MTETVIATYEVVLREVQEGGRSEFAFTDTDILTIRRLLAQVAMSPEVYDLSGRLSDALGDLPYEEVHYYTIGKTGDGSKGIIPAHTKGKK